MSEMDIVSWAKRRGYDQYLNNRDLLRRAYFREHGITTVKISELIPETKAAIDVLVADKIRDIKYHGCRSCYKKSCSCGKEDYDEIVRPIFMVGDETGTVELDFAPWVDCSAVKTGVVYHLEGRYTIVQDRNGKEHKQFSATTITEKLDTRTENAVKLFKDYMELRNHVASYSEIVAFVKDEGLEDLVDTIIEKSGAHVTGEGTERTVLL